MTNGILGNSIVTGDLDGDRQPDLMLSSRLDSVRSRVDSVLSGLPSSLAAMDAADGVADGVVDLTGNPSPGNLQIYGSLTQSLLGVVLTDFDGDGRDDIVMGIKNNRVSMVAYLIASSALFGGHDIATASTVHIDDAFALGDSYQLYAPEAQSVNTGVAIAAAGDVDADGLGDILLAVLQRASIGPAQPAGVAYLIMAADLPVLDAADGAHGWQDFSGERRSRQRPLGRWAIGHDGFERPRDRHQLFRRPAAGFRGELHLSGHGGRLHR